MPDNYTRHTSSVALVLIDVINHFEFPDGDRILLQALPMAARLARLKQRCRSAGIPAIYVNDNFGQWRSDAKSLIARCLDSSGAGKPFVDQREHAQAIEHIKEMACASVIPSTRLRVDALRAASRINQTKA